MLSLVPIELMLVVSLIAALVVEALYRLDQAWSRPALAIYLTVSAWYLLDLAYNDWSEATNPFSESVISRALLQIAWFLITFRIILEIIARSLIRAPWALIRFRRSTQSVPDQWRLFAGLTAAQLLFAIIGLIRTGGDPWNILYPPAADPPTFLWGRAGVGEGLDFLVSAAGYIHISVIAMLGVLVATTRSPRLRMFALAVFLLALPPYLFQRARNTMLAVLFPGILAYLLVGRATWPLKIVFAAVAFFAINSWFLVVIATRDGGGGFGQVALSESWDGSKSDDSKHHGLDMFTELCYMNTFLESGSYRPNNGELYFAQATAVVPRAIWPNKPLIGIDYAIARGFSDPTSVHGVNTTVSTGMIGQGVANFGPFFGPVASAFLMAIWTVILARTWIRRSELSRLFLFMLGIGLTFNMGRDITLLVLFPYFFAAIIVAILDFISQRRA